MALASSSGDFGTMKNKKNNNNNNSQQQRRPGTKINLTSESNSSKLNFYESMYNFKKMFPLLESDVIEVVLRSNDGDVEKTIDQLLTLVRDEELARNASVATSCQPTSSNINMEGSMVGGQPVAQQSSIIDPSGEDQPPAYNEIFSASRGEGLPTLSPGQDSILGDWSPPVIHQSSPAQLQSCIHVESTLNDVSSVLNATNDNSISQSRREFWNRAMVGPLRKDFLRIRLTSDQIKKLKSNIKKAKRDEITAIVNNKTPENPDLSFELKRKFTELTDNLEANEDFYMDEWRSKYDELLNKYKARQEQAIQDEYIAKLIHNEERFTASKQAASVASFNFEDNFSKLTTTDAFDHDDESNAHSLNVKPPAAKKKLSIFGKKSKDAQSHMSAGFASLNNDDNISIASNGTSVSSRKEYDFSDDEQGYNINRIRQLEESSHKANGSKKNVFQTVKSVIKRNSMLNSSIGNSFSSKSKSSSKNLNTQRLNPFGSVDFNNNQNVAAKNATTNDLIVFSNDYTYDEPKPFSRSSDFDLLVNTSSRKLSNGFSQSKNLLD